MATINPAGSSCYPPGESCPAPLEPWHDVLPKNAFVCLCYKALCMIAVSKSSVEHLRHLTERPIKEEWITHKEMVVNRFENMNVTVSISGVLLRLLKLTYRRVW
jgi:hypothetical protein